MGDNHYGGIVSKSPATVERELNRALVFKARLQYQESLNEIMSYTDNLDLFDDSILVELRNSLENIAIASENVFDVSDIYSLIEILDQELFTRDEEDSDPDDELDK